MQEMHRFADGNIPISLLKENPYYIQSGLSQASQSHRTCQLEGPSHFSVLLPDYHQIGNIFSKTLAGGMQSFGKEI